jgi:hypothetical protein
MGPKGGPNMPLLDHFHAPLSEERDARSFLGRWAVAIADSLNPYLPEGWYHTGPLTTPPCVG